MKEQLTITLSPLNARLYIVILRTLFYVVFQAEKDFLGVFCAHTIWKVAYSAETAQLK